VADEQHRLAGLGEPRLQPAFAGHVEVVVRLVQQQHLLARGQQRLQDQAFLLAARQRADLAEPGAVERHTQRGDGHRVPEDLGVVPTRLAPRVQCVRVPQLGGFVVGAHHGQLGVLETGGSGSQRRRRDGQEQVADRAVVADRADELRHHAEPTLDGHAALGRRQLAGQDPQQRGLAGAVRANECDDLPAAHPERDVAEQPPTVIQSVAKPVRLEESRTHTGDGPARPPFTRMDFGTRRGGSPCVAARRKRYAA
jgi:hypothetical protein